MAHTENEILLTGATGYIGQHLLGTWLEKTDQRINLIVRSRHGISPVSRIEQSLREACGSEAYARWSKRLQVFEGDVSQERLGLDTQSYKLLTGKVSKIIHCAAAARFDLSLEDARLTNVGGVKNMLTFAGECKEFQKLDYIGTAYVAGMRSGTAFEDELDVGQEHRNTYERSKFEAELLVRQWMAELPISVIRPSVVICDSKTGKASNHNGFYRAIRMYLLKNLSLLPGETSSPLDLVPVDYVCDAIFRIAHHPKSTGMCYNLTAGPERTTTLGEIQELASRYSGQPKFKIVSRDDYAALLSHAEKHLSDDERAVFEELSHYVPYLFCDLLFDNSNTVRDTGLQAPLVRDYFELFIKRLLADIQHEARP
ncbi:SDR family oxidoreductase [bacterium]|nr:SDR family oxidoreductase [bacterium]MBU1937948.1 SDR family oxidoreductase [bacterium]